MRGESNSQLPHCFSQVGNGDFIITVFLRSSLREERRALEKD